MVIKKPSNYKSWEFGQINYKAKGEYNDIGLAVKVCKEIEAIFNHYRPRRVNPEKEDLNEKINRLCKDEKFSNEMKQWMHTIRKVRNKMTHPGHLNENIRVDKFKQIAELDDMNRSTFVCLSKQIFYSLCAHFSPSERKTSVERLMCWKS